MSTVYFPSFCCSECSHNMNALFKYNSHGLLTYNQDNNPTSLPRPDMTLTLPPAQQHTLRAILDDYLTSFP